MPQRIKILRVSYDLLAGLFRQDATKQLVFEGMPADARVTAVADLFSEGAIALRVESDTFDEIGEGNPIPMLEVTVREVQSEPVKFREFF